MPTTTTTLRPGLLVSLSTSVRGNVRYVQNIISPDQVTEEGSREATWETTRTIIDPAEHEAAIKARSKARTTIRSVCAISAFGMLCPEIDASKLETAIAEARQIVEEFNAKATVTRVSVYVLTGRIAPDDVEAVKAINSEVRELLDDMAEGIKNLDVERVREAATKAKSVGQMLSPDAQVRVRMAIDAARDTAKRIVAAGEAAALQIDQATLNRIAEARGAFLDLDDVRDVETPDADGRAIDLDPAADVPVNAAPPSVPAMEI